MVILCLMIPVGITAISRRLSEATPPVKESSICSQHSEGVCTHKSAQS
jgi:hypothetical protein